MPKASEIYHDGAWAGRRVFVIGGGPSLSDFDFSKLQRELTIGVNMAFTHNPTIAFSEDVKFQDHITGNSDITDVRDCFVNADEVQQKWLKFDGVKVFHNVQPHRIGREFPGGYSIDNSGRLKWSQKLRDGLAHGTNSGTSALNLADVLAGPDNTIYLLGFDMKGDKNKNALHWHKYYKNDDHDHIDVYAKTFIGDFEHIKNEVRSKVINLNPDSALETFPKSTWDEEIDKIHSPVVVSYYTIGTPYEKEAVGLAKSCRKFSIPSYITGIPNQGDWASNVRMKPLVILMALDFLRGRDILYVDVDARIERFPCRLDEFHATKERIDVGGYIFQRSQHHKQQLCGGTLYFANNPKSREFVRAWISKLDKYPLDPCADQEALWDTLQTRPPEVRFRGLGAEYCWIFDAMPQMYPDSHPIILHNQKSREYRCQL
jgi:hypothetical protein